MAGHRQETVGCSCDPGEVCGHDDAVINQVLMVLPAAVGSLALARYRARLLFVYLPAVAGFFTLWRKYVCARCQYYGRDCSTLLGIATARMMPRDESHELDRNTMLVDFAWLGLIGALPVRQVLKSKVLALTYFVPLAAGLWRILTKACPACGNDFCPMKDVAGILGR